MKKLDLHKQPARFLEKLNFSDKNLLIVITSVIEKLCRDPVAQGCRKLVGYKNLYRIRIDKYRVIYHFDEEILTIVLIAKREEVYNFLKN